MGIIILAIGLCLFAQVAQADWTVARRLTVTSEDSRTPAIAIDSSGNLHLVWADHTPGNYEIYYKKGTDGGATWTSSQRLSWASGSSYSPAIAVDSYGRVHVVWADHRYGNSEIYYKKSVDGGGTWTPSQRLTLTSGSSRIPSIAVDSFDNLYFVFTDETPGNAEIYYKKSTDGGATWTTAQRLTVTPGESWAPDIAIDSSDNLHIVWRDDTPGNREIYYKKGTDGGTTWTTSQRLSVTPGDSQEEPAIAIDSSGNLHVVWYDSTPGNFEIYYKKSADGGTTWTADQRLTENSGESRDPTIAIDSSNNIYIVWSDHPFAPMGPWTFDLFYKKSADGGATWTPDQRLTWTPCVSWSGPMGSGWPDFAIDSSGNLHIVWLDKPPQQCNSEFEIYYKKGK